MQFSEIIRTKFFQIYSNFIKWVFVWISFKYKNSQACWLLPQLSRGEKVSWSPGGSNLPECWGKMLWVGKWELEINLSDFNVWPRPRQVLCIPYMIVCADVWLSKHPWPLGLCTQGVGDYLCLKCITKIPGINANCVGVCRHVAHPQYQSSDPSRSSVFFTLSDIMHKLLLVFPFNCFSYHSLSCPRSRLNIPITTTNLKAFNVLFVR